MPRLRKCKYCDGTGEVPGWEHLYCQMCKGKGKVERVSTPSLEPPEEAEVEPPSILGMFGDEE